MITLEFICATGTILSPIVSPCSIVRTEGFAIIVARFLLLLGYEKSMIYPTFISAACCVGEGPKFISPAEQLFFHATEFIFWAIQNHTDIS